MASTSCSVLLLAVALLASGTGLVTCAVEDEKHQILIDERRDASDAVIHLNEESFFQFLGGSGGPRKSPRPYTLIVFMTAHQVLQKNPQLMIGELRQEYGIAARAFAAGPDADKVFFAEAVFEESHGVFQALSIEQLPLVIRFGPSDTVSRRGSNRILAENKMSPETVTNRKYPWTAEDFADLLGRRHGLRHAPITRPTIFDSPLFWPGVLLVFGANGYLAYELLRRGVLFHPAIYAAGSLLIFWFSVSGGMFNIIRGMPLFIRDREGRLQFFLSHRQGQLGAEGFILGSTYMGFSACVALLTYAVPKISSLQARQGAGLVLVIMAAFLVFKAFELHAMKTGYQVVSYL